MKKRNKFHNAADRGTVRNPAALAALASPVRQEIVDTIEALGGQASVADLARQLGRPADGLYYHVRSLIRAGVLEGDRAAKAGQFRTATPGTALVLDYAPRDARHVAGLRALVGNMLRIARRDFDAGLAADDTVVKGAARTLWASRAKGWLSPAEIVELNLLLHRIHGLLRRPRRRTDQQLVSVCFVMAPIAVRPQRRSRSSAGSR